MEVRTRDPRGSIDRIYGTIAKAASKNKFLDFRNSLTLAYLEDYANLQGIGGSKHAPVSGIKLLIQDNSNGGSQKAEANIPCWLIDKLLEVCRRNAVDVQYDGTATAYQVDRTAKAVQILLKGLATACGHLVTGKVHPGGPFAEFGSAVKKAGAVFTDFQQFPVPGFGKPYAEYSYRQERVNPYSRSQDGFVRVSLLTIQRKQFNSKGEIMKSPWSVNISNFEAAPNEQKNGTTSYKPNTKRNEVSLFIQVSDDDMWRCLYSVQHFISVWEMAYGIPLVQNGIAAYEYQQQNYRQAQQLDQQRPAPQQNNGGQNTGYGTQNNAGYGQFQNGRPANNYNGGNDRW